MYLQVLSSLKVSEALNILNTDSPLIIPSPAFPFVYYLVQFKQKATKKRLPGSMENDRPAKEHTEVQN